MVLQWFKSHLPEIQTMICIQLEKFTTIKKYILKESQFLRIQFIIEDVGVSLEMPISSELFEEKTLYIFNMKQEEFMHKCLAMHMSQDVLTKMLIFKVGDYLYVRSHWAERDILVSWCVVLSAKKLIIT